MPKVDMSAKAVATRLKRVAQLRRLGLSLQQAKLPPEKRNDSHIKADDPKPESRTAK